MSGHPSGAPVAAAHVAHLDMLRGAAALVVLVTHLRGFLLVDFHQTVGEIGPLGSAFYFLTGLGQQAVMLFFVLSGLFIYGAIQRAEARGAWSWGGYAVDRLSRLWVVLIPALLLTLFWDSVGRSLSSAVLYRNDEGGLLPLDPITLAGNLLFLNTVVVESYGSSLQLWSLANEFWYYLLFPLWLFGLARRNPLMLVAAAALTFTLPFEIRFLFPVWLMGAALHELHRRGWGRRWAASRPFLWGSALLFLVVLALSRFHLFPLMVKEYAVGLSASAMIYALLHAESPTRERYRRFAGWLSGISYTLYLSHLALIVALASILLEGQRLPLTVGSFAAFVALLLLCLAYAHLLHHLFERHTGRVRRWLRSRLNRPSGREGC